MGERLTGGCQCGAVRFATTGPVTDRAICHCRMCQKAVGSTTWPFFTVEVENLEWTRGNPALFRSSEAAFRGFCARCGTPLSFQPVGGTSIDLSIGSLDDPSAIEPDKQYWADNSPAWFATQAELRAVASTASPEERQRRRSYQHPDHDTTEWPVP